MEFIIVSVRFSSLLFLLTKQEKFWQSSSLFLEYDSSPGSAWVEMTGKKKKKKKEKRSILYVSGTAILLSSQHPLGRML